MRRDNLFAPNSHSSPRINWRPVSDEQKKVVSSVLGEHYGIRNPAKIVQIGAQKMRSNNFRITYEESGRVHQVLLRKNIQHYTSEALIAIDTVMRTVAGAGLPAPEAVLAKDGSICADAGGVLWQLFRFIEGEYYHGTAEELREASCAIAALHRALSLLSPSTKTGSPDWVLPNVQDFKLFFQKAENGMGKLDALLLKNKASLNRRIKSFSDNASSIANAGTQLIHADLHPHNLLFCKEKLAAILDFGDVRLGFRAADAASACHRLVRQYIVFSRQPWPEVLAEGLRLFLEHYQSVFPLPHDELKLFSHFMELALLGKMKGNLSKYYHQQRPEWPHDVAYQEFVKQTNLLTESDVMRKPLLKLLGRYV